MNKLVIALLAIVMFASACGGSGGDAVSASSREASDDAVAEVAETTEVVQPTEVPASAEVSESSDASEVMETDELAFPEGDEGVAEVLDALEAEGIDRDIGERIVEAIAIDGPVEPFQVTMAAGLFLGMAEGFGFDDPNEALGCIFDELGDDVSLDALGGGSGMKAFAACGPAPSMFVTPGSEVPVEDAECAGAAFWNLIDSSTVEEVEVLLDSVDFPPTAAQEIAETCDLSDEDVRQLVDG